MRKCNGTRRVIFVEKVMVAVVRVLMMMTVVVVDLHPFVARQSPHD